MKTAGQIDGQVSFTTSQFAQCPALYETPDNVLFKSCMLCDFQDGGHSPANRLTETGSLGLQDASLILDVHVMLN